MVFGTLSQPIKSLHFVAIDTPSEVFPEVFPDPKALFVTHPFT
jgi:hypothetical protein